MIITFSIASCLSKLFLRARNYQTQWTCFCLHSTDLLYHLNLRSTDSGNFPSFHGYHRPLSYPASLGTPLWSLPYAFHILSTSHSQCSQNFSLKLFNYTFIFSSQDRPFINSPSRGLLFSDVQHLNSTTILMSIILGLYVHS